MGGGDALDAVHTLDQDLLHLRQSGTPPLHVQDRGDLLQVVLDAMMHLAQQRLLRAQPFAGLLEELRVLHGDGSHIGEGHDEL